MSGEGEATSSRDNARTLIRRLASVLGQNVAIEHIGSTAVEGMRAKPIIDLMMAAHDEVEQDSLARDLVGIGWSDMGEAGVPGRRYLRQRLSEDANIHIVLSKSHHWSNNLAIRDYLRAHPHERALYSELKDASLQDGTGRLLDYSNRKLTFITGLQQRATTWRQARES